MIKLVFVYGGGFLMGMMFSAYRLGEHQSVLLGECEKDLPRNERCKMVAAVDEGDSDG